MLPLFEVLLYKSLEVERKTLTFAGSRSRPQAQVTMDFDLIYALKPFKSAITHVQCQSKELQLYVLEKEKETDGHTDRRKLQIQGSETNVQR
jgi:hypothetical protein